MIMEMMRGITDMNDYMSILNLLKNNEPLTKTDIAQLVPFYSKYGHYIDLELDPSETKFAKICLVADIMKIRSSTDPAQFAGFEFTDNTIDLIVLSKEIADRVVVINEKTAADIVSKILNENDSYTARIILARVALDAMTVSEYFDAMQRQIREIASFLIGIKKEAHKYAYIVRTIRGG